MDQQEFLSAVEGLIEGALSAQAPTSLERSQILLEAGRYLSMLPGAKRARPRLTYCFGKILGAPLDQLAPAAVAGEFIHAASLLHDDVVDDGTTRRGHATVNARWGNAVAVLGGDVMLCLSIRALCALPRVITDEAVDLVALMSRAAILEVEARGDIALTEARWRTIAEGKTGALFGWCGRAGAHLVGDHDALARFDACGRNLGIAFQLADDLKDITQSDSGKDRFADITNRNPSFALLTAWERSPALKAELGELWASDAPISQERAQELGLKVLDTGAGETTRAAILHHVEAAFDALGPYRSRPGGDEVVAWATDLARAYVGGK
jgi:geranylgeranyl pyrophosphate synthase